ncbi:GntR family transcriptional regulator [Verminephrobacter eiseniae]|uniref:GntR family transcriptional regulator n=1 Tax=Verminephrobacter eiseniae TaxID=364317 RepID=UPI00223825C2|nr:GntR family transcriptional regulator [Verminephrobacter eiseniae]MCW5231578.1 GntR family transcriptional regulator [Verminephrobacter eiseniae]MCW5293307.1 GntR family transcriptional regulator [Verminephrobacter eiseniae]MCW8187531.1 GntR family transcriptional regulator [Verminephrobacter eiseniae]MCW8225868.1 GntR family transcriptional regulator [Verminephrobacter eiseniae]MCW8236754.1 GntR family transcriptional regulator [Verminephrobacter eiseniae]
MRNSREAVKLTASDAVYETLRHKIMNNQLPGGSQLLEEEVATQLNVSRTPVRAALSKLEAEGLVQAVRRHGYRITPITVQDIHEIYQILSPLETVAAELLAEKNPNEQEVQALQECVDRMDEALQRNDLQAWADADELFHTRLVDLCGNQRLARAAKLMFAQSHRVRLFALRLRDKPVSSVKHHGTLVDAIRQKRPALAREIHGAHRDSWTKTLGHLLTSLNIHQL